VGRVTSETRALVELQGYVGLPDVLVADLDAWLRVPPFCCGAWVAGALWVESVPLLCCWLPIAAVAGATRHHPFDVLYNWTVRRRRSRPVLPPLPPPRRSASVCVGLVVVTTAGCLIAGLTIAGVSIGITLAAVTLQQSATGFCVGSWSYRWMRGQLPGRNGDGV
jgi:hypothetical protein